MNIESSRNPQLPMSPSLDETTERERALALCRALIEGADEVGVFDERITAGMEHELGYARSRGIPVCFEKEVRS